MGERTSGEVLWEEGGDERRVAPVARRVGERGGRSETAVLFVWAIGSRRNTRPDRGRRAPGGRIDRARGVAEGWPPVADRPGHRVGSEREARSATAGLFL